MTHESLFPYYDGLRLDGVLSPPEQIFRMRIKKWADEVLDQAEFGKILFWRTFKSPEERVYGYQYATDMLLHSVRKDFWDLNNALQTSSNVVRARCIRGMACAVIDELVLSGREQRISNPERDRHINLAARLVLFESVTFASKLEEVHYDSELISEISKHILSPRRDQERLAQALQAYVVNPTSQ